MKFKETEWHNPNTADYHEKNLETAREYAKQLNREFGEFAKVAVLFGSLSKNTTTENSDIDILVVIDDVRMELTQEVLDAFQIINEKMIIDVSERLHIHTITLTSFWEFIKNGDPVIINILRDGIALIDYGFFNPLQRMLYQGRIRPTIETIHNYSAMAPRSIFNADMKVLQAVIDLYWAVIDITHAYIMKMGELPISPEHVSEYMKKYKAFSKEDMAFVQSLYDLTKNILYRRRNVITGKEYDILRVKTEKYYEKIKNKLGI